MCHGVTATVIGPVFPFITKECAMPLARSRELGDFVEAALDGVNEEGL